MFSAVQAPQFVRPIKSSDLDRHTSNGIEEGKFLGTNLGRMSGSELPLEKDAKLLAKPMEMTMKIRDIMTTDIELVHPDTTAARRGAEDARRRHWFSAGGRGRRLVGTLTDRDITIRAVAEGHDPKVTRVRRGHGQ